MNFFIFNFFIIFIINLFLVYPLNKNIEKEKEKKYIIDEKFVDYIVDSVIQDNIVSDAYYASKYKDCTLTKNNLVNFLKKISLNEKEINYAIFLATKETSFGKYGIGKPPINNIIGMKIAYKRKNWGFGVIKDYYNSYISWTYCFLDFKYYIKKYKNYNYNDYK